MTLVRSTLTQVADSMGNATRGLHTVLTGNVCAGKQGGMEKQIRPRGGVVMRNHRIALLGVLALLPALPASARVLGSGPTKTDCYAAFEGVTATSKGKIVDCTDGDPSCDFDTDRGTCTFHFTVCAFITDSGLSDCKL